MKKLFSITAALSLLLSGFAQQTIYYDFYPNNANPPGNYIISLQTGDKTPGGTPYNFWTLNQMIAWLALRGITNATIFQVTSNIAVTTITTNLIVLAPGGFTNLNLTPNTVMFANINQVESSIPNGQGGLTNNGTGTFGWFQFYLTKLNDFGTNMNFSGVTTFSGTNNAVVASPGTIYYGDGTGLSNVTAAAANKIAATNVFSGGTLPAATIGAFTGDVTTPGGSYADTLKNTGTPGTYTKTTFDSQGRETSGASAVLASADYANQGTTTTVLHGNAAGNPSFASVANADMANSSISFTDGAGIGGSGSPTSLGSTYNTSAKSATPQFAGINLTGLSSSPVLQLNTNAMSSVTNTLDWTKTSYTVVSPTACQITGFANLPTTNAPDILWHGVNTSGSNWVCTYPLSVLTPNGVRGGTTCTNGQHLFLWFHYDPDVPSTNVFYGPSY